jgi:hypothetical protein
LVCSAACAHFQNWTYSSTTYSRSQLHILGTLPTKK